MDVERLHERITDYLKAVGQLEKTVEQPKDEFLRDSVIQRLEFIGLWEQLHNPDFKAVEFDRFMYEAGSNTFVLSPGNFRCLRLGKLAFRYAEGKA